MGMLRVQAVLAESIELIHIHQGTQILIIQSVDLLQLVRGTEAIKEMHEGMTGLDGRQMRHSTQIHGLLGAGGSQHGKAGGTAGHHVGLIAKDGPHVLGHGPGRNVENTGQELAGNPEHGRDHQHQALRSSIGGGQGAGLQGAVAGARSASLRLHLNHLNRLSKQVLLPLRRPLIDSLSHLRRGRDRVDGRDFGKRIGSVSRSGVTIHYNFVSHF